MYRNECMLYIQYIGTLQVCVSATGVVVHYIGWGFQSPDPKEIQYFNREFCLISAMFFRNVSLA